MTIKNDEGLNGELAYLKKDDAHHYSVTTFLWSSCSSFHNTEKKGNITNDGLEHKMTMIDKKQMTRF
jgi:hypothetical protein